MTSPTTTEPKLAEPFAERVERLARELRRAIRFDRPAILLAVYRSEFVRAEAEAALRDRLHKMGQRAIPVRVTSPDDADLPARLRDWPDQGDAVFFVNGLQWGAPTIYSALNVRREYFVSGRLRSVFWLTEAEAVALTTRAPDFWVFRHRVVEFVEPPQVGKAVPLARELAWRGFDDRTLRQDTAAKIALREALLADLPEGEGTEGARAELLFTLGGLYRAGRQYERAIAAFQQALALAQQLEDRRQKGWLPDLVRRVVSRLARKGGDWWLEAGIHNGLGNVYCDLGRHDEAIAEFKRAIELDPSFAHPHNGLGNVCSDLGRHDEAIAEYRRALELDPTCAYPHNGLGYVYRDLGRHDEAIAAYQRAIELDPDYAYPHNNLGLVYRDLGRYDEAIAEYRRAVELDPTEAGYHSNLGNVYRDLGRHDEAITEFKRAIELDPSFAHPHNGLGSVYRDLGRHDEAIAEYRRAIELDPTGAYPHNGLGNVYRDLGRHDEAIAEYRRAVELDPTYASPHNGLGLVYRDLGRHEEAMAAYQRAIELDPTFAYPHNGLGNVYRDLGRHDEAMAAYQRAIELDPTFAYPHNGLGNVYRDLGRYDEAIAAYQRAIELDPTFATAHISLASLYRYLGRTDDWARHIAEARRLVKPDDTYNLACLESVAGNDDAALEHLAQALAQAPGDRAWAVRDPDLAWVRDDPRFQALVGGQEDSDRPNLKCTQPRAVC